MNINNVNMKKIVLLLMVSFVLISCKSSKYIYVSKQPQYDLQLSKNEITKSDYVFLCQQDSEMFKVYALYNLGIKKINHDKIWCFRH